MGSKVRPDGNCLASEPVTFPPDTADAPIRFVKCAAVCAIHVAGKVLLDTTAIPFGRGLPGLTAYLEVSTVCIVILATKKNGEGDPPPFSFTAYRLQP